VGAIQRAGAGVFGAWALQLQLQLGFEFEFEFESQAEPGAGGGRGEGFESGFEWEGGFEFGFESCQAVKWGEGERRENAGVAYCVGFDGMCGGGNVWEDGGLWIGENAAGFDAIAGMYTMNYMCLYV
jgi:hypothetical protein